MPCYEPLWEPPVTSDAILKDRLNKTEAMLCAILTTLDRFGWLYSTMGMLSTHTEIKPNELLQWYEIHTKKDKAKQL